MGEIKASHPRINIDTLCQLFGYSRQAFYQLQQYEYKCQAQSQIVLEVVSKERQSLLGIGGRKLLGMISNLMKRENIHIGGSVNQTVSVLLFSYFAVAF